MTLTDMVTGDAADHRTLETASLASQPVQCQHNLAGDETAQAAWHADLETRERTQREADEQANREYLAKLDATTWASALPACEVNEASITPLATARNCEKKVPACTIASGASTRDSRFASLGRVMLGKKIELVPDGVHVELTAVPPRDCVDDQT